MSKTYYAMELANRPTLCTAQCCDLKLEEGVSRVWLCRTGGGVTIERLDRNGVWVHEDGSCYARHATV